MNSTIPFHKASIDKQDIEAVVKVIESGWLTTGKVSMEFEKECGKVVDNERLIALSSGTAALSIAYRLSGFENERVVIPSYTFGSCVAELLHINAKPILVDIDEHTMNIDIEKAKYLATKYEAKGVIAVHFAGQPCNMQSLEDYTEKNGLRLVDDAAHAFGAVSSGRAIGSFRSITAFSFYATKCITTAEGGLISFYEDEDYYKAKQMSLHGISKDAWKRYSSEGNWYYEISTLGMKANMPDMLAALGINQVRRNSALRDRRMKISLEYDDRFAKYEELIIPKHNEMESVYHLYPLRLNLGKCGITRNDFISHMIDQGVGCSVHFIPVHLHPYFAECGQLVYEDLSITEEAYLSEVSLPIYPDMTPNEIDRVVKAVENAIRRE